MRTGDPVELVRRNQRQHRGSERREPDQKPARIGALNPLAMAQLAWRDGHPFRHRSRLYRAGQHETSHYGEAVR
jgi:hypothetical protein